MNARDPAGPKSSSLPSVWRHPRRYFRLIPPTARWSWVSPTNAAGPRVAELLGMLVARLKAQRQTGSRYYVGHSLTATDVYSATFAALFNPLPPEQCRMEAGTRAAFTWRDAHTDTALDPIFFEHRDMMYRERLELPLSL
jgi:glutathione S-transferase